MYEIRFTAKMRRDAKRMEKRGKDMSLIRETHLIKLNKQCLEQTLPQLFKLLIDV